MNTYLIAVTVLLMAVGIIAGLWSIKKTREEYYKDYIKRKRNEQS